ncbi:hypothetical protein RYH74_14250 [Pseudomonas sp. LSJ-87]|uniref:hypothetical protein n=1 Tax=Pseudomonas sp. LSJ-87 TaxID=3079932 RepID=UPI002940286A|nr:hypothetical protein [Pseudomonas sp. LSJ-87]MDV5098424.1 hypothetical protein [Pseudomonas sp. LSJ-87]
MTATNPNPPQPDQPNLATNLQKLILVTVHFVIAALVIWWAYSTIKEYNQANFAESTVTWEMPTGVHIKDSPVNFNYDPERQVLTHRGPLDAQQQLKLRALLEFESESTDSGKPPMSTSEVNKAIRGFYLAIDGLAYQSASAQVGQLQLLLLLGFMGGVLGAILRSLVDFIGHACYTKQLDLIHWWPLYATRPIIGAILGFLLVVLLKSRLMASIEVQEGSDSFWWLGITVIGGFSTVDVTQRLRLTAKALFGSSDETKKKPSTNSQSQQEQNNGA